MKCTYILSTNLQSRRRLHPTSLLIHCPRHPKCRRFTTTTLDSVNKDTNAQTSSVLQLINLVYIYAVFCPHSFIPLEFWV